MNRYCLTLLLSLPLCRVMAQEFPAHFSMPVELAQGFAKPDGQNPLYLLTLQAVPQVTLVPKRLRLGAVLGGFYPATQVGVLAGPRLTLKLLEGGTILTATSFNVHLLGEYLWATGPENGRRLVGGGIGLGSSDLITVAFKLHRDLSQSSTWFQVAIGYNLVKPRAPVL
ncbi:hypothetical protein [Spirosoma rhododendri]|uniref:Uncharacterized protein n=1 Tax=Spirosoma rhododendri TaxID=2728024 RepID=A0A7L5DQR7_9BACT|nr:hypothetical protein [Spirosoma rhododendri]QJD80756.1 hypothetical protein HH216_21790 [Spirosoma rhododendri]